MNKITVFWFRRDLRLFDNHGLYEASKQKNVLPLFIFDSEILDKLADKSDARVTFIYNQILELHKQLNGKLKVVYGKPKEVFSKILKDYEVGKIYANRDYEPYALERDGEIKKLMKKHSVEFKTFKDQVVFEGNEVSKDDDKPYTVFTPYKNKWLKTLKFNTDLKNFPSENVKNVLCKYDFDIPSLNSMGFSKNNLNIPKYEIDDKKVKKYESERNFPAAEGTTNLGIYLRFGTVSVRALSADFYSNSPVLLSELIWREFYMQILYHFPHVVNASFKSKYDRIEWLNNEKDFEAWCKGKTGYPIVDAGMRELNETGTMHNRVRMVVASFLVKHLLIDWRWGEAYFAEKLLDFELASNNGNWQWAAGCGCDAAPYFRVFNPYEQHKKFDKESKYVKKWVPELEELTYPQPIIDHKFARNRAIEHYKNFLS